MRTGCLSVLKNQSKSKSQYIFVVKKLTILTALFVCSHFITDTLAQSSIVQQEKSSNYNRIIFYAGRDQLNFKKNGSVIQIKTLNEELFNQLKNEVAVLGNDKTYIKNIQTFKDDGRTNAFVINFELINESVEMFSFYREREKKYVLDLWMDGEETTLSKSTKVAAVEPSNSMAVSTVNFVEEAVEDSVSVKSAQTEKKTQNESAIKKVKKANTDSKIEVATRSNASTENSKKAVEANVEKKINEDEVLASIFVDPNRKFQLSDKERESLQEEHKKAYKDFRYGATFFWDYDPVVPALKDAVNLEAKTPEVFFPILNRKFEKNEREAHLQLTINLYKKKNFGLMNKSITLFQQKYGEKAEWELLEYIKVNALLRENIEKPDPEIFKNAIGRLNGIVEKSDNYEMKKGIWKYLLTHYLQRGDFLRTLQFSKDFYAGTRANFDFEESPYPAEVMLYSLARLGQVQQLAELSAEKNIKKVVSPATVLSYSSFAKLKVNAIDEVISLYEKSRAASIGELSPTVIYNAAEAYFRKGDYLKAFSMFQKFSKEFPYELTASNAILRMALCSDLLERDYEETLAIYKDAVDKAINSDVSYEARLRYVAFRSVRKNKLDDRDREIRIFLEQDKTTTQVLNKNLNKLLYQVRLRTLIVDGKYKEAFAYFSLIPLSTMAKIDVRSFEGDAAEIAYGLIDEHYKKAEYTQVIKFWQAYKNVYVDKVAMDPYLNFIVGSSYVKLGLFKGFDEVYAHFKELKSLPMRTFPIWVARPNTVSAPNLLAELAIIKDLKLKNTDLALREIEELSKAMPQNTRLSAYKGLLNYYKRDYKGAISELEVYLSSPTARTIYDPQEVADLVRAYTDSIFETNDTEKFTKVADAILNDTNSFGTKNAYMQSVRERIAYLAIEILSGRSSNADSEPITKAVATFKKNYPKSIYLGRINYLYGLHLVKNQRAKEGKEVFTNLINDTTVSDYIKELAKSELSILNLKDKTF